MLSRDAGTALRERTEADACRVAGDLRRLVGKGDVVPRDILGYDVLRNARGVESDVHGSRWTVEFGEEEFHASALQRVAQFATVVVIADSAHGYGVVSELRHVEREVGRRAAYLLALGQHVP